MTIYTNSDRNKRKRIESEHISSILEAESTRSADQLHIEGVGEGVPRLPQRVWDEHLGVELSKLIGGSG